MDVIWKEWDLYDENVVLIFSKGCNSGGRALRACVDLLNAVSFFWVYPRPYPSLLAARGLSDFKYCEFRFPVLNFAFPWIFGEKSFEKWENCMQGFEHVNNMEGGYSRWVDSGFAGDKPPEELKLACKFRP